MLDILGGIRYLSTYRHREQRNTSLKSLVCNTVPQKGADGRKKKSKLHFDLKHDTLLSAAGFARCTPCRTGLMCHKCLSLVDRACLHFSFLLEVLNFDQVVLFLCQTPKYPDCGWKHHWVQMILYIFDLQRQCRRLSSPDGQAPQHQRGALTAAHRPVQGPGVQKAFVRF